MDNEKPTPPVKRTVIVLDHSSKFLGLSKQHIDFDGGGKKSKGKSSGSSGSSPVFKSCWTCSIEAAVEYCRIVYDIFPSEYLVRVYVCLFLCLFVCLCMAQDQHPDHNAFSYKFTVSIDRVVLTVPGCRR